MKRHLLTFVALVCSLMVSAYDFEKDLIYYNITSETDLTVEVTSSRSFSENQIYSWQGAAGGAAEKGGVATGHGACEGRVNYANGDYYTLSVSGKKANIDTDYILITLDKPLEANDKLEITAYRNKDTDANGTLYILFENGQAIDEGGEVVWNNVALGQEPNTNSYNVGEGAGSKTIKLVRSATSTNVFITKFVITRSANTSNITFADSKVKEICVAKWDTNGDGELSLSEAARVTGIGQIFNSNAEITSFDELQYFTSVETLAEFAFSDCSSLTSVTLPAGVTSIGIGAFSGCSSLTSITIPESVTRILSGAFEGCSSLTSITIPDNVTYIGGDVFRNCSSLTSITFPAGLTSIGDGAFSGCSSLTSVTLPAGLTSIESGAFNGCSSLTSLTLPVGVTSIGNYAFRDCSSLTSLTLPAGVTSIAWSAFEGCSSLTSITIPESVTRIGDWAFQGCSSLTSLTLPAGLTSIGESAFRDCSSLTSLTLPAGLTSIGNWAFNGCNNLKTVINLSALDIVKGENTHGYVAYYADKVLTPGVYLDHTELTMLEDDKIVLEATVILEGSVTWSSSNKSVAIVDQAGHVTAVGTGTTTITARAGNYSATCMVTVEPRWSFDAATGHLYVNKDYDYGSSLSNYPWDSFRESIKSVELSSNVTSIGDWAFAYCSSLTSITISEGVTSIGESAFMDCSSLTSITLPTCVTSIGNYAFLGCTSLTSITLPEGVTSIGEAAFWGCSSLTSLTLPASVTSIGTGAFGDCSSLTSVTLPASVTSIGTDTFWDCSSLTSITLPAGVTSIGEDAFYGCDNLKTVINLSALDIVKGSDTHGHVAYYADKVLTPGVYLDHTELTMQEDDKIVLEATVIPEGPVTWSSSDETVATVKDGVVTTLKPGEVTITAKAGEQTSICVITVKAKEVIVNPEEAFYSWQGAAGGATEKGGVATGHGACEGRVNYANGDYYTLSVSGKKANIDTDYILITLDQPLEANDNLEITAYRNKDTDANGTLYILFENGQAIDEGGEVVWNNVALGQEPNTNSYNVGGGAGSKTIKLSRSATSTNVFITKFLITRSANGLEEVLDIVVPTENIIYNLQGQKLNTNSTQGLPRGLYIINGKKVLVK